MRYVTENSAFLCKPFLEGRNMNEMRYVVVLRINHCQRVIQQEYVYDASKSSLQQHGEK